ncbi:MAG: cupin domain-containing protein [Acidiferrobacterales bacterium]
MKEQEITFRKLLHPMSPEEFFEHAFGKLAVHIPGEANKFADLFSWDELNRLLNQPTLWSDRSMKMVLDGHDLRADEFCSPGRTREGHQAMLPDPARVDAYLQQGATLVLDLVERLSPGVAALAASLEMVLAGVAVCNAYCSWKAHQGFSSHFDTTDVFALHIAGQKTWRLYEGRFQHPIEGTDFDYASLPPEQHASAKGKLLQEVVMTPGDVLYIPRGQYHDAIAASDASLHLSYGLVPRTGHDLMTVLLRSLVADPLFRAGLPHFDDETAYRSHLQQLADRLRDIVTQGETAEQAREDHRTRVLRDSLRRFTLPTRQPVALYRVRWRQAALEREANGALLRTTIGQQSLSTADATVVDWIMRRDYFDTRSLREACSADKPDDLSALLDRLTQVGLIERL